MEKAGIPAAVDGSALGSGIFFPVSLPFLMSSQQMELDFGCGGIQQRESQGSGSRHYGMEG